MSKLLRKVIYNPRIYYRQVKSSDTSGYERWFSKQATTRMSTVDGKTSGPRWRGMLLLGLGTLTSVPLSYIAYKYYRVFSSGATVRYDPTVPIRVQIFNPIPEYRGTIMHFMALDRVIELQTFEIRPDDVIIAGFPRSGTTWTQELVYLIANTADTDKAMSEVSDKRVPLLEFFPNDLEHFNKLPSPRFFKSHLHYHLLPRQVETKRPKIVYIMRNPKDVSVSFFHLSKTFALDPVKDDLDLYVKSFINGRLLNCPWSDHVKGFWERRNEDNILFLKYEDMIKDVDGAVRKIASFLGKTLTDKQVATVIQHCSFNTMKHNDKANFKWLEKQGILRDMGDAYIRKGKVGDWKNYYTKDQSEQMERMVTETLSGTGLTVEYEIDSD